MLHCVFIVSTNASVTSLDADLYRTYVLVLLHLHFYLPLSHQLQLLSEVRGVIRARDLAAFNELTVQREMAARKASINNYHS